MVVLIIFPVILQTVINFRMLSIGGQRAKQRHIVCKNDRFLTKHQYEKACWCQIGFLLLTRYVRNVTKRKISIILRTNRPTSVPGRAFLEELQMAISP